TRRYDQEPDVRGACALARAARGAQRRKHMEADLHDLTPAYALDALSPDEAREYEAHLARCERCRAELASFSEAAGALAYATEGPTPPPELRARILQQAQPEPPNLHPLPPP